jgi:hypothetical protein
MALALIVIGIIVALLLSTWIGLALILIGIVLLFVPAVPYGYSSWHGRRAPP